MAERGEALSERELAVLERLIIGGTNREIAADLDISHNTVKVHLRNVFAKLGVSSRTEATTVALQKGLVKVPGVEAVADESGLEEPDEQPPDPLPAPIDAAAETAAVPVPPTADRSANRWLWPVGAIVLLLALLGVFVVGPRLLDGGADSGVTAEATAEPFTETPLGKTGWLAARDMPQERAAMALVAVGLDLFQIGGEVQAGVINLVSIYETKTGRWRGGAPKPTAVAETSAAVLFGEIYVPGGRLADGRPTAVVEAYSPANNAWRPVTALPRPLSGSLVVPDGGLLYVFGGWDGQSYTADAFAYDPSLDSWQALPPMSQGRARAVGAVLNNRLYVVGGYDGERELAVCEYFEPGLEAWSACPDMELGRAGAGAAALSNNQLYVIGGGVAGAAPFGEVFDAGQGAWSRVEMPMLGESVSWHGLGVASVETRIYVMGGRLDEEMITANYVYQPFTHRTFLPAVGGDS